LCFRHTAILAVPPRERRRVGAPVGDSKTGGTGCLQPVSRSDRSSNLTTETSCGYAAQVASNRCHPAAHDPRDVTKVAFLTDVVTPPTRNSECGQSSRFLSPGPLSAPLERRVAVFACKQGRETTRARLVRVCHSNCSMPLVLCTQVGKQPEPPRQIHITRLQPCRYDRTYTS
jgi:hypothetical protein